MPLAVAIVGAVATYFITTQQIKSTEATNVANLRSAVERSQADQKLKILEIFSAKIASDNTRDRQLAVRILTAVDSDLAVKLSSAILVDTSENKAVLKAAEEVQTTILPDFIAGLEPGDYAVVVASANTEEAAKSEVLKLKDRYPSLFSPRTFLDETWGDGIYKDTSGKWAVYVGGLYSKRSAKELRRTVTQDLGIAKDAFITKP